MGAQATYRRRRYPWRLGATSFVIPADLLANVRRLAGMVDDVQLLFFESRAKSGLPHPVDVAALMEVAEAAGLTYTAHLPADIRLGAAAAGERQAGVDEIERLLTELAPLAVRGYDLHLPREAGLGEEEWLANLDWSLARLAARLGPEKGRIGVENVDYPLARVAPLVREHGLSLCLDVGHLLRCGHDWRAEVEEYLPRAQHLHYHGVIAGKDHQAVVKEQAEVSKELGGMLARHCFGGVVTLEMYELVKLETSLLELASAWEGYARE